MILKPLFCVKLNSEHILLNKVSSKMPLNGRKWPDSSERQIPANHIFAICGIVTAWTFKAIYDHLEAFRMILKPLFYVKLNSEHILLNKVSSKMPLNGRKWPWKVALTITQIIFFAIPGIVTARPSKVF